MFYFEKYKLIQLVRNILDNEANSSTNLHAVCEHDADGHEFGEDPEELRVGQHAVLQTVVQEAGVMTENVVDV